ncbi:MAG: cytochrome P450, partial [Pseudomonadota bacterium]
MLDIPRGRFVPPHIPAPTKPLTLLQTARLSRRNALSTIPALAYRTRILSGTTGFRWHLIMSPDANKRIFLDNVDNYPKSKIAMRLLEPAIGKSIFTSHGE